jgi:hypothetical protein
MSRSHLKVFVCRPNYYGSCAAIEDALWVLNLPARNVPLTEFVRNGSRPCRLPSRQWTSGRIHFIARYSVASVKASSAAIVDDIELAVALPAEAVTAVGSVSQSETDMN